MSAKELTIFIPKLASIEPSLIELAAGLSMSVDDLSSTPGLSYQFSARRSKGPSLLSIEYKHDDFRLISEISRWAKPGQECKGLLLDCLSSITILYRDSSHAKEALVAIGLKLKDSADACVVENGQGCLLKLVSMLDAIRKNAQWSWERYEFPEFPGIATSEWR